MVRKDALQRAVGLYLLVHHQTVKLPFRTRHQTHQSVSPARGDPKHGDCLKHRNSWPEWWKHDTFYNSGTLTLTPQGGSNTRQGFQARLTTQTHNLHQARQKHLGWLLDTPGVCKKKPGYPKPPLSRGRRCRLSNRCTEPYWTLLGDSKGNQQKAY